MSVVYAIMVGRLERITTQIEQLWKTQWHKRFLLDVEAVRALLGKDDLVLIVAQSD
jgi:hypothetical protein